MPIYGFLEQNDGSMLLQVFLSSGWYLKYFISIEDIIKS